MREEVFFFFVIQFKTCYLQPLSVGMRDEIREKMEVIETEADKVGSYNCVGLPILVKVLR